MCRLIYRVLSIGSILVIAHLSSSCWILDHKAVAVSLESDCEFPLDSVEIVFGDHIEYFGSIEKGVRYTVVDVEYPVVLEIVEVRFELEGGVVSLNVPVRSLAPDQLDSTFELAFRVLCGGTPKLETTFWEYVKVDGAVIRQLIEN